MVCVCLISVEVGSGLLARPWRLVSRLALGLACPSAEPAFWVGQSVPLLDAHCEELAASMNELREPLNNKGIKAKANITRNTTDSQNHIPRSWKNLCLGRD